MYNGTIHYMHSKLKKEGALCTFCTFIEYELQHGYSTYSYCINLSISNYCDDGHLSLLLLVVVIYFCQTNHFLTINILLFLKVRDYRILCEKIS